MDWLLYIVLGVVALFGIGAMVYIAAMLLMVFFISKIFGRK